MSLRARASRFFVGEKRAMIRDDSYLRRKRRIVKPRAFTTAERQSLERFKAVLKSLVGDDLLSLRLFGSRAREEGTDESDLDVLVVLRHKDRALCRRIVEAALDVDLTFETNLAPTIVSAEEYEQNRRYNTPFYSNVERESVPL